MRRTHPHGGAGDQAGGAHIGAEIRVTTTRGHVETGEFHCYDVKTNFMMLRRDVEKNGDANFFWVKMDAIREVKALSHANPAARQGALPHLSVATLEKKCREAEGAVGARSGGEDEGT
jgi:hypothetical protein